jgi:hypothetical protein
MDYNDPKDILKMGGIALVCIVAAFLLAIPISMWVLKCYVI